MTNQMFLPIAIIVSSNIFYNITTKAMPEGANPFAQLIVTYLSAAFISLVLMIVQNKGFSPSLFSGVNWLSVVLAFSVTFLELGYILAFRAGWNISVCSLVANIALAVALFVIGVIFYREGVSVKQICGMALCLVGLFIMNFK